MDYYGVPKIAHYFVRSAYAPLHVCALHESYDAEPGKELPLRLVVLDDTGVLAEPAEVTVRLYDAKLREVASKKLPIAGAASKAAAVHELGEVKFTVPQADVSPLLAVVDLASSGNPMDRTFYWFNFRARPGCLFELPKTTLNARREGGEVIVENTGKLPAVGVHVAAPECSDSLRASDGSFWLDAGQRRRIAVEAVPNIEGRTREVKNVRVAAWNANEAKID